MEKKKTEIIEDTNEVIEEVSEEKIETQYITVTINALNVRSKPSLDADIVKIVREGDRLELIKDQGEWIKIPDGYVMAQYVTT